MAVGMAVAPEDPANRVQALQPTVNRAQTVGSGQVVVSDGTRNPSNPRS